MLHKIELEKGHEVFAEPTPLGLVGLAIGCAALTPIAFGHSLTPAGLKTAAIFCLLFGGGCQLLAGLMNFANRNLFGGTILTAFSFNWMLNYWTLESLATGVVPDHSVLLATDVASLVIFLVVTVGFGFFSKLLVAFLADIDLLYACKIVRGVTGTSAVNVPIALLTVALGLIALWIAFAGLINPTAGRPVFRVPGPLFAPKKVASFDWSMRTSLFDVLFAHWSAHAFEALALDALEERVAARVGGRSLLPDLAYLEERGAVVVMRVDGALTSVRLSAAGIDVYEQLVLKKYAR